MSVSLFYNSYCNSLKVFVTVPVVQQFVWQFWQFTVSATVLIVQQCQQFLDHVTITPPNILNEYDNVSHHIDRFVWQFCSDSFYIYSYFNTYDIATVPTVVQQCDSFDSFVLQILGHALPATPLPQLPLCLIL